MFANRLVIFARLPRLGTGKRRLARDIGVAAAVQFQRTLLASTLRHLAGDGRWITYVATTPDRSRPWPRGVRRLQQGSGDLGRRMARVARGLPPGPVVIVGCDIPDMRPAHVAKAFRALGRCGAVFGPAADGGYWLVGLRRRPRFTDPFAGVRWSTPSALEDTIANLGECKVLMVDVLADVDDGAALATHRSRTSSSRPGKKIG
jgi:rSAM/selenodomain-associated transferase 1